MKARTVGSDENWRGSDMERVFVAMGTNWGERDQNLVAAAAAMEGSFGPAVLGASLYRSAPVDCEAGAPEFFNTVLAFDTELPLAKVASLLWTIEAVMGRKRDRIHEPREIDLDLLLFGSSEVSGPQLTVPHPRMAERGFVLAPLAEMAPDLYIPHWRSTTKDLWLAWQQSSSGLSCSETVVKIAGSASWFVPRP